MGDLFQEMPVENSEQELFNAIFGNSSEAWSLRMNEASAFVSDYIGRNPKHLTDAVIDSLKSMLVSSSTLSRSLCR